MDKAPTSTRCNVRFGPLFEGESIPTGGQFRRPLAAACKLASKLQPNRLALKRLNRCNILWIRRNAIGAQPCPAHFIESANKSETYEDSHGTTVAGPHNVGGERDVSRGRS